MLRKRNGFGIVGASTSRKHALETMFGHGFPYSRKLTAHDSCINHMAFSSQGARYLATGGDDLTVHVWDFHQEDLALPSHSYVGPRSNIFTLSFSATNKYLFAGGTDCAIHKFDTSRMGTPDCEDVDRSREHIVINDIVRSISCHPTQDEVFLSASDDGCIIHHDQRTWTRHNRATNTIQAESEVTDVKWHPTLEHIFATSEERGHVRLRDGRMGFGSASQRSAEGVVHEYNTKISKGSLGYLSNPESSSLAWDADGQKLVVTVLNHRPTVYALMDPNPIAVLSAQKLPDGSPVPPGQRTYSNSCTMKHGSVGSLGRDNQDFYCGGSDDYCAYIWRVPPVAELIEQRVCVPWDIWSETDAYGETIGYAQSSSSERYVPASLDTPMDRLTGHQSIVNTTLIHPSFPFVLVCGIEQHIFLHSTSERLPFFDDPLQKTSKKVRELGEYEDAIREASRADFDAITLFDHILQQEREADPFVVRRYVPDEQSAVDSETNEENESSEEENEPESSEDEDLMEAEGN